jgi:tetratricopeptide (TPR) repeat protein
LLLPYADLNVLFGPLAASGSAARYLALLAATCGRIAEARQWFERALDFNRRIEAIPCIAWTEAEYAAMLQRTGAAADLVKAHSLLESAFEKARRLQMRRLEAAIGRLLDDKRYEGIVERPAPAINDNSSGAVRELTASAVQTSVAAPEQSAAADVQSGAQQAIFRNDGDYWTIEYRGSVVRLRHGKGLTCLAYLLSHPEAEIHAASLAAAMADKAGRLDAARTGDAEVVDMGDAGPLLDTQAKAEYARRLRELRERAEDLRERGDSAAALQVEEEMDFIAAELGRAVGIGGRDRRAASAAERARLNVTKAIKSMIARIAEHNRVLGQHLAATVKTGTFCSYTPDPGARISWRV